MTTTVLRAVKFVGTRIENFKDDRLLERIEEGLKFVVYLTGPILLPIIIMYLSHIG